MKRIRTFLALFVILGGLFATPVQAMATTTSGAEATGRISASSDSNQTQSTVTNTTVSSASASSKQVSPDNNENTQKASNEAGNKEAIRGPSVKAKKMLASTGQDISNNITSLSVNSTRINDGGKTTVKLNYNDSYQKIHEGDYINVTWPSSGTVYGSGYTKTIELNVDGVDVGTLTVTTSSAKIVFNSNVEDLDNVHGWAEFDIEGRNLTNTSSENTGTFSITSGSKEATVSVVKPASGTTGVFYYKTGDMNPSDTDHVRWFLNINNEKSYVDDRIFISDNIQTGQKLNLNSFDITVNGYNPNHFYGSNAIPEFEAAYPGASISVNKETGKITVVIPQSQASLNSFSIMYLTDIVDYNQKSFKNNSTAWYTEHNKEAVNGKDFNYSVSNVNTNGGVDGENKTTASVTKVWNGTNNKNQPNEVKVQLYANGEKSGDEVTLNESNSWKHNWNSLVKYAHGKSITYTVKEVNVPENYKSTVSDSGTNNFVITNTYTPSTTTVSGTKTWKDNDDQDGKRPDSIKVNLLANGKVVQSKTVKASDNWKYSFTNLPEFENGKKISYTVTEDQVKDYSTTVDGYNLTNSYTPAKTSVSVTKAWNDNNNQDGSRPNEVKVQLYANGEKSGNEVTLNAANKWTHTWTELAEKSNKRTVQYSVKEVGTVKGYTSSVNGENGNFTVTNTHTPSTTTVSGTKTWKDNDDQDGKRPDSIKVNLLANGKVVQSKTVKASDNWKYSFTNLPEFENGKKISYTVTEDQVKDYSTTVDGYNLTNSYTPAKTSVSVTKAWNDNNNQDGSRPNEVKVQLYANGEKSGNEVTLNAANKWTHTWTGLAEKSNKRTVQYSVKEVGTVKGYTSSVNGENGNFTVTNTHTPSTPNVPTNKTPNKSSRHNNPIKKIVQKIVQRILPQTGSSSETYLIAIGGVLLILLLSVILLKRKKK